MTFRLFDAQTGLQHMAADAIDFRIDDIQGSVDAPVSLTIRPPRLGDPGFLPTSFRLDDAFPNPFNPSTDIGFGLPTDAAVKLSVYNVLGQRVRILTDDTYKAGYHHAHWDGRDDAGQDLTSGLYFAVMHADGFHAIRKLMRLE